MPDIKYEILQSVGIISETSKGWQKELNIISWNGREPSLNMIYVIGHQSMKKWGKVLLYRKRS
jgi:hypothetical protein